MSLALYFPCLLGMQCDGFTIIAADQTNLQSIVLMKNGDDNRFTSCNKKLKKITLQFTALICFRYNLNTVSTVHFARNSLAEILRSNTPSLISMLIGGYDTESGAELYTMDFLGSSVKVPFGSFGFGGIFSLGIMDECYRPSLTVFEAYEVLKLCVKEIQTRLFVNLPSFQVKVVSKEGIQALPIITH
ncbi:hypothetical protein K1T71_002181 [Dendrolimus kikuchii]|uniref:Uncharacterized protein n=1 Tax=Dendrolimus kikuchii TaxID=765133 RepID=A0ACC1DHB5_9NEOP|nr:hypothetical protein K1T71_002181 [Dendrolimus kikuchii]